MQEFIAALPEFKTAKDTLVLFLMLGIFAGCVWIQRKTFTSSKSPEAVYKRSVAWYQTIMSMPIAERTQQLDKWAHYTKNLPTPKNNVKMMDC